MRINDSFIAISCPQEIRNQIEILRQHYQAERPSEHIARAKVARIALVEGIRVLKRKNGW
jgi:Cu/Ag efflux pump CusA